MSDTDQTFSATCCGAKVLANTAACAEDAMTELSIGAGDGGCCDGEMTENHEKNLIESVSSNIR